MRPGHLALVAALAGLFPAGAVVAAPAAANAKKEHVITASGASFSPKELVVKQGETVVFAPNPREFEPIARNKLGETARASIAVSDGELYVRTYKHLWCISEKK